MALTLLNSGTACSTTVEQTLYTSTTANVFVAVLDLVNILASSTDAVTIRVKTAILSGGTERLAYLAGYRGAPSDPIKISIPVPSDISYTVTLEQPSGTLGRDVPWKVMSLST